MRVIKHKFLNVTGDIDLDEVEIISVPRKKHARVDLCFKANMHIPFARIILHSKDRFVDAEASFESAVMLGDEIERRWKLQAENKRLREENKEKDERIEWLEMRVPTDYQHDHYRGRGIL